MREEKIKKYIIVLWESVLTNILNDKNMNYAG